MCNVRRERWRALDVTRCSYSASVVRSDVYGGMLAVLHTIASALFRWCLHLVRVRWPHMMVLVADCLAVNDGPSVARCCVTSSSRAHAGKHGPLSSM